MFSAQWAPLNSSSLTCGDVTVVCRGHRWPHPYAKTTNYSQTGSPSGSSASTLKTRSVHLIEVVSILSAKCYTNFKTLWIFISSHSYNHVVYKYVQVAKDIVKASMKILISTLHSVISTSILFHF